MVLKNHCRPSPIADLPPYHFNRYRFYLYHIHINCRNFMEKYYGRGLGSQCYLTCLHASCNVATFNVWLFNVLYSCFNSNLTLLHSISSFCNLASVHLTFVFRPCRIFTVQCIMPFFVLPLFILRPAIILTLSCHYCFVYANCNYTSRWRFTRTNKLWVGPYTLGLPPPRGS